MKFLIVAALALIVVPVTEAKVPHVPDVIEQDIGDCRICMLTSEHPENCFACVEAECPEFFAPSCARCMNEYCNECYDACINEQ